MVVRYPFDGRAITKKQWVSNGISNRGVDLTFYLIWFFSGLIILNRELEWLGCCSDAESRHDAQGEGGCGLE